MDINCTNKCAYQVDGKCILQELPAMISATYDMAGDCPYGRVPSLGEFKL